MRVLFLASICWNAVMHRFNEPLMSMLSLIFGYDNDRYPSPRIVSRRLISPLQIIKSFLPWMLENDRGHIVTIASGAGLVGATGLVDYCSSKFAAVGLHEALT